MSLIDTVPQWNQGGLVPWKSYPFPFIQGMWAYIVYARNLLKVQRVAALFTYLSFWVGHTGKCKNMPYA